MSVIDLLAGHRFEWRTAGTWCSCGWGDVHWHHIHYDEHLAVLLATYVERPLESLMKEWASDAPRFGFRRSTEYADDLRDVVNDLMASMGVQALNHDIRPVIREVLEDHIWRAKRKGPAECWSANDRECGARFTTGGDYRRHVAELIAKRVVT